MAQIKNTNIMVYDLNHIYIADCEDDNAERRMLKEAQVSKVTIKSDGNVSFYFEVAGNGSYIAPDDIVLYYDIASYKSTSKRCESTYDIIGSLLTQLGIPDDVRISYKPSTNSYVYIVPTGYIINDSTMVEAVDFPDFWEFTRAESEASGTPITIWKHNANFYDKPIFRTREEALVNHSIKLLKLNGDEINI